VGAAVDALADGIARAVCGAGDAFRLSDQIVVMADQAMGLAAVRVLGADALAPFVVSGRTIPVDDVAVVRAAVEAFPAPARQDRADARVWGLRDWALGEVVVRLGNTALASGGLAQDNFGNGENCASEQPWPKWSAELSRLSTLALPGLDGPVHDQVRRRQRDTLRGVVRAMMRTDFLSAARLIRWLAVDATSGVEPLLTTALQHLELVTGPPPRVRLEIAMARWLLAAGSVRGLT
jgi:hypothetical protein